MCGEECFAIAREILSGLVMCHKCASEPPPEEPEPDYLTADTKPE
jgi:hypothetical protein